MRVEFLNIQKYSGIIMYEKETRKEKIIIALVTEKAQSRNIKKKDK
jgi:hypothetical protein